MEQLKFYKYASLFLLLANIALVTFLVLGKPKKHHDKQDRAIDLLKMDEKQHDAFLLSANRHHEQMDDIETEQRVILKRYFSSLTAPDNTLDKDSILLHFQTLEIQKIQLTYQHFEEVKSSLHTEQLPYFDEFMNNILKRILKKNKKPPPPPKDSK